MAGHQKPLVLAGPFCQSLLRLFLFPVIFSRAGGIVASGQFQRTPEISHQKTGKSPERIVKEITLMPVHQKNFCFAAGFNHISLVKWSAKVREDNVVYIGRDVLEGPQPILEYGKFQTV